MRRRSRTIVSSLRALSAPETRLQDRVQLQAGRQTQQERRNGARNRRTAPSAREATAATKSILLALAGRPALAAHDQGPPAGRQRIGKPNVVAITVGAGSVYGVTGGGGVVDGSAVRIGGGFVFTEPERTDLAVETD